jgi:putative transcriptional regulator
MDNLYVCLFSNGLVKVGRSINPMSRIDQHVARVACLGVELAEYRTYGLAVLSGQAHEEFLIERCAAAASQRFKSEWFAGLDFMQVSAWAEEIAAKQIDAFVPFKAIRDLLGVTQAKLAEGLGCTQTNVSLLDRGQLVMPETAVRLVDFAAERGVTLTLDQVYGLKPLDGGLA